MWSGIGSLVSGGIFILLEGRDFPGRGSKPKYAPDHPEGAFLLDHDGAFQFRDWCKFWSVHDVAFISGCRKGNGPYLGQYLRCLFTDFYFRVFDPGGWITDRIGPQKTLMGALWPPGSSPSCWGLSLDPGIILIVFLQSILATSFFPAGFAALSRIGSGRIKKCGGFSHRSGWFLLGRRFLCHCRGDRGDGRDGIFLTRLHPSWGHSFVRRFIGSVSENYQSLIYFSFFWVSLYFTPSPPFSRILKHLNPGRCVELIVQISRHPCPLPFQKSSAPDGASWPDARPSWVQSPDHPER